MKKATKKAAKKATKKRAPRKPVVSPEFDLDAEKYRQEAQRLLETANLEVLEEIAPIVGVDDPKVVAEVLKEKIETEPEWHKTGWGRRLLDYLQGRNR